MATISNFYFKADPRIDTKLVRKFEKELHKLFFTRRLRAKYGLIFTPTGKYSDGNPYGKKRISEKVAGAPSILYVYDRTSKTMQIEVLPVYGYDFPKIEIRMPYSNNTAGEIIEMIRFYGSKIIRKQ